MNDVLITATATVAPDLGAINDAFQSRNWALLTGLILAALVWVFRATGLTRLLGIPSSLDKYVAMGLAMLGSIASGLISGQPVLEIILGGLGVGAAAIGAWEAGGAPLKRAQARSVAAQGPKE